MRRVSSRIVGLERVGAVDSATLLDPATIVLVVTAVILLIGGLFWLVRRRLGASGTELTRILGDREEISILMHPHPDPDAMASAVAVKHLAEHAGTRASIQYPGQIRHQENRAFHTVLDLDLEQIGTAQELAGDAVVLVDHNRPRGFGGADAVEPYTVIDHHPGGGDGSAFTDVRTDRGSCASILAEYFDDLDAELIEPGAEVPENPGSLTLPSDVATGLMYGILSDTMNLTRGCSRGDFDAIDVVYPAVDEDLLDRIANPEVDAEVLDVQSRAIAERDERSPYAISDVGLVDNLDTIPQAADELMHLEGVTAIVVIGEKDGNLHFSGRSRDDRVHIGRALETAVEDIPMAGAGGHARMGGGQISIDHMEGLGPSTGLTREDFHERLFDVMAGEA